MLIILYQNSVEFDFLTAPKNYCIDPFVFDVRFNFCYERVSDKMTFYILHATREFVSFPGFLEDFIYWANECITKLNSTLNHFFRDPFSMHEGRKEFLTHFYMK